MAEQKSKNLSTKLARDAADAKAAGMTYGKYMALEREKKEKAAEIDPRLRRGIKDGLGIEAGEDYGIFAGLRIKVSRWLKSAIVTAKEKPENLISGFWVGQEGEKHES